MAYQEKQLQEISKQFQIYGEILHADEAARIAGRRSGEIPEVLGYSSRDEIIHRDDLVIL